MGALKTFCKVGWGWGQALKKAHYRENESIDVMKKAPIKRNNPYGEKDPSYPAHKLLLQINKIRFALIVNCGNLMKNAMMIHMMEPLTRRKKDPQMLFFFSGGERQLLALHPRRVSRGGPKGPAPPPPRN